MRFYGDDFFAATKMWDHATKLMYLQCIWFYYAHTHVEGLPNEDEELRILCGCEVSNWARTRGKIFDNDKFFRLEDGRWHQTRARDEYLKAMESYQARCSQTVAATQKSLEARRAKALNVTSKATPNETLTQPEPEPLSSESVCAREVELPAGFPKSPDDAVKRGAAIGCPVIFITTCWNKAMGRGGRDARDVPIRNFASWLAAEWSYEQGRLKENENKSSGRRGTDRNHGTYNQGNDRDAIKSKIR